MTTALANLAAQTLQEPVSGSVHKISPPNRVQDRPTVRQFTLLIVQLAAVIALVYALNLGQRTHENGGFLTLILVASAGFCVHCWLPLKYKRIAFLGVSLAGGWLLLFMPGRFLSSPNGGDLASSGRALFILSAVTVLALFAVVLLRARSLPWMIRIAGACVTVGVLAYGRYFGLWLPNVFHWQLIGSLFMLRGILYALEMRNSRRPESLIDGLNYFLLLPNFYFPLFPIVDYVTFRDGFLVEDVHVTAQRGIFWIARGLLQLAIDRVLYHHWMVAPDQVNSVVSLLQYLCVPYLLYMRISGQFHIAVGMLLLFGYRLPETSHKYMLASSFTEFWRRANIYWKDFMVNAVYYAAYLRLRRWDERWATGLAVAAVFAATMLLHSYQYFWLQGYFQLTPRDLVFWTLLGLVVATGALRARRSGARREARSPLREAAGIVLVFSGISIIWSLWTAPSVSVWYHTVTYWL